MTNPMTSSDRREASFLFTADSHLRKCQWVNRPDLAYDAYYALSEIVQIANHRRLPIVHGGDLFDVKNPESQDIVRFKEMRVHAGFYFVQGDHDKADPPWATLADFAIPLHDRVENVGDIPIAGYDFAPRGVIQQQLASIPGAAAAVVTHLAWKEIMRIGNTNADAADVANVRYVLTGDYHRAMQVQSTGKAGQPLHMVSPGSSVVTAIDEAVPRQYVLVYKQASGVLSFEFCNIPNQRHSSHYVVDTDRELNAVLSKIEQDIEIAAENPIKVLRKPRIRVSYPADIEGIDRLRAYEEKVHLFYKPIPQTDEVVVNVGELEAVAGDALVAAVNEMANNEQLRHDATRLLQTNDLTSEYQTMLKQHKEAASAAAND